MLPVQPAEADAWLGRPVAPNAPTRLRKFAGAVFHGTTGAAFERIARNEDLRARAA
jgi:hypothetical protein